MLTKFLLFTSFLFIFFETPAQKTFHSIYVNGKITSANNNLLNNAKINIFENNNLLNTYYSNNRGNYEFTLEKGKVLIIEFSKDFYVSKKIEINTSDVTDDELKYGMFPINLDISLFENFQGLNVNELINPVAKLKFSDYDGDFVYDDEYTKQMNIKIEKIVNQLSILKNNAYNKEILIADSLYNQNKLEFAWISYLKAHNILDTKPYPISQINKIKEKIAQIISFDEAYNKNIERGDKNYKQKKYKISLNYYNKSLIYKPEESYPLTRIKEIEKMLSDNPQILSIIEKDEDKIDIFTEKLQTPNLTTDTNKIILTNNTTGNNIKSNNNSHNIVINNPKNLQVIPQKNNTTSANKVNLSLLNKTNFDTINIKANNLTEKLNSLNLLLKKYVNENDIKNQIKVTESIALLNYQNNDFNKSIAGFKAALSLLEQDGNQENQAIITETVANIYEQLCRYNESTDWYKKASELYGNTSNINKKSEMLIRLGDMNFAQAKFNDALSNYFQSYSYDIDYDPTKDVSSTLNNIGAVYYEIGKYDDALKYFQKSEQIANNNNNKKEYAMSLNNIGNINYEWNDVNNALLNYYKSVEIKKQINNTQGISVTLHNIGNLYKKRGNLNKALEYYFLSSKAAKESGNSDIIYINYKSISEIYSLQKNCELALEYFKLFSQNKHLIRFNYTKDQISETNSYYRNIFDRDKEIFLLRNEVQKQRLFSWYESQRRVKEINFLTNLINVKKIQIEDKESKMKTQKLLIIISFIGIILLFFLVISLWIQRNAKRKANIILKEQNEEIKSQKEEILCQRDEIVTINNDITDSIKYAKRIQNAIFHDTNTIKSFITESFIYFKPRDLVSGDFYWVNSYNEKTVIAVADCTGHGVPGAFMSILGYTLLNQAVDDLKIFDAAEILNKLRQLVIKSLHQTGEIGEQHDGMDMAICIYDTKTRNVQYAGANSYLYKMGKQGLTLIKSDRMPVSYFHKNEVPFTNHTFQADINDMIYLSSDGILDQFGGANGKKFRQKSFIELITKIYEKSPDEQYCEIDKQLIAWMGDNKQVDDILVLGFKIC